MLICNRVLVGKAAEKDCVERMDGWKVSIKMDLQEIVWGGLDWVVWLRMGTGGGLV